MTANALLGLPPVVVGLVVYLLLSRSGPLGVFGILFTPGAMVIAQCLLGTPIVIALVHRTAVGLWHAYGESLRIAGASRLRAIPVLMSMGREALLTAFLAAFGRAIAEVGAIIIVGGNIRGYTRTMTTRLPLRPARRFEPGARIGDDTHPHCNDCQRARSLPGARVRAPLMRVCLSLNRRSDVANRRSPRSGQLSNDTSRIRGFTEFA